MQTSDDSERERERLNAYYEVVNKIYLYYETKK